MAQATPFSPSLVKSEEGTTKPKSLGLKSLLFSFLVKNLFPFLFKDLVIQVKRRWKICHSLKRLPLLRRMTLHCQSCEQNEFFKECLQKDCIDKKLKLGLIHNYNRFLTKHFPQGVKVGTFGRQNESNISYVWLAHTSIFGLFSVSVCLREAVKKTRKFHDIVLKGG